MVGGRAPSANYCIMKIVSKFLMICALMISSVSANAAPSLPVVEILGKNYYVYEIKRVIHYSGSRVHTAGTTISCSN